MRVLITGHTSGIGESLLDIFVENGFMVYGVSRNINKKINISNQFQLDLSLEDDIDRLQPWISSIKPDIFFHSQWMPYTCKSGLSDKMSRSHLAHQ